MFYVIQNHILNQSKYIPPGYIFWEDIIKKIILQVLRERNCSVNGAEQVVKKQIYMQLNLIIPKTKDFL